MLGRAARCHPSPVLELSQTAPGPPWEAARLKPRPEASGSLQAAASSASSFDSTVDTESDDLTTGMNGSFSEPCSLLLIQGSQTDLICKRS